MIHMPSLDTVLYTVNREKLFKYLHVLPVTTYLHFLYKKWRLEDFPEKFDSFTLSEEQYDRYSAEDRKC